MFFNSTNICLQVENTSLYIGVVKRGMSQEKEWTDVKNGWMREWIYHKNIFVSNRGMDFC